MKKSNVFLLLSVFFIFVLFISCSSAPLNNKDNKDKSSSYFPKRINASYGNDISKDSSANVIITGGVSTNVDFNNDGDTNDTGESSAGFGSFDVFIVKYGSNGSYLWSKRLGNADADYGVGVISDSGNNVIVAGSVTGNVDFNQDGDTADSGETGIGNSDVFIVKYNSTGVFQWAKRFGGGSVDEGNKLVSDSSNNIYITGYISGDVDFNQDGDYSDYNESVASTCYGGTDIFIIKFDLSGIFQWARRMGGADSDEGRDIVIDKSYNVILTGYISNNADLNSNGDTFDSYEQGSNGYDIFISKWTFGGIFLERERIVGLNTDIGDGIITDQSNNIIITGYSNGSIDLNQDGDYSDNGETGYGDFDVIIFKYNSSLTHQWTKRLGGSNDDRGFGVDSDTNNDIIVTGYINGNFDFNQDADTLDSSELGIMASDIFVVKYNSSGLYQWSKRLGGGGYDEGEEITVDSSCNIVAIGTVNIASDVDLNGDGDFTDGSVEITNHSFANNVFISKFDINGIPK